MVRPARPNGHGQAWEALEARHDQIQAWVTGSERNQPLSVVKVETLLARSGCVVPYRTLHRYAVEAGAGSGAKGTTVRVVDGEPGVECQIDFAQMGFLLDPDTGRRRKVHALIFTAVVSRHMFVWLSYSQTLAAVVAGGEAAWTFFQGVFKVLIPEDPEAGRHRPGPGQPGAVGRVVGLLPARRVRHRHRPGRLPEGQAAGGTDRAVRARQLLGRGDVSSTWPRARRAPRCGAEMSPGRGSDRTTAARPIEVFTELEADAILPRPASMTCRCSPGEGPPRLPRRGRPRPLLGARAPDRAVPGRPRRLPTGPVAPWRAPGQDASETATRWAIHRPGRLARGTRGLCDAGPEPAHHHRHRDTARTSGSTPNGSWMTRCPGPGCARSTDSSGWSNATVPGQWRTPVPVPGPRRYDRGGQDLRGCLMLSHREPADHPPDARSGSPASSPATPPSSPPPARNSR